MQKRCEKSNVGCPLRFVAILASFCWQPTTNYLDCLIIFIKLLVMSFPWTVVIFAVESGQIA